MYYQHTYDRFLIRRALHAPHTRHSNEDRRLNTEHDYGDQLLSSEHVR